MDAETAFEVIGKFAKEYLGADYETVYSVNVILSILVYTLFSRMFDLMQPPVVKHSIAVA